MKARGRNRRTKDKSRRTEDRGQRTAPSRRTAVQEALVRAHDCPFACGRRAAGHGSQDTGHNGCPASTCQRRATSDEGRDTSDTGRAGPACCRNCVYAVPLQDGARELLVCTGCPLCPGKMRVTEEAQCCRSFEKRRVQTGRAVPPKPPDESIRYIPLTKGLYAIIDAADYERVARHKWCASGSGRRMYAYCHINGKTVALHRFLTNAPKGMVVDHIDGNGLNDRQSNLRVCTQRQNLWNSQSKGRHSRYKGVCWDKGRKRWVVYVRYEGRNIFVGRFRDEVEAARAYDRKAYECFGEYAYLNFPYEITGRHGERRM